MAGVTAKSTVTTGNAASGASFRNFISTYFLGGARGGVLSGGIPGRFKRVSQPQFSPAFFAVFWYSSSKSIMDLRLGQSIAEASRRPFTNRVGVRSTFKP